MTTPDLISVVITPALSMLPGRMDSTGARAMLIAIADIETDLMARRQQPTGPARGLWQFERIAVEEVLTNQATRDHAADVCGRLIYPVGSLTPATYRNAIHAAIEHNDVLACVFARLLLWTLPIRLPFPTETDLSWKQYLDAWRPGKPHPDDWPAHYARAWAEVTA